MRCTNSEPGTFNHECGKPAVWIGTRASGHQQGFCVRCRAEGCEARGVKAWQPAPNQCEALGFEREPTKAARPIGARVKVFDFGAGSGTVIEHAPTINLQGREIVAHDWIRVRLDTPRPAPFDTWAGNPSLTDWES